MFGQSAVGPEAWGSGPGLRGPTSSHTPGTLSSKATFPLKLAGRCRFLNAGRRAYNQHLARFPLAKKARSDPLHPHHYASSDTITLVLC